jgi:hypothetical protein
MLTAKDRFDRIDDEALLQFSPDETAGRRSTW